MKKYTDYKNASISMSSESYFINALDSLFKNNNIEYVLESGTFNGLGSTTTLAKSLIKNKSNIKEFFTIEIDKKYNKLAKKNLQSFSFITPICGLSVSFDAAKQFIETDEAINFHEKFPDIYIDDIIDPKAFYLNEINGNLSGFNKQKKGSWLTNITNLFLKKNNNAFPQENLLEFLLLKVKNKTPLILLDSAGGIGYLEFKKTMEIMHSFDFYLILDDVHHLKHFRSYWDVKQNSKFTILSENIEHGWILAKYSHQ